MNKSNHCVTVKSTWVLVASFAPEKISNVKINYYVTRTQMQIRDMQ